MGRRHRTPSTSFVYRFNPAQILHIGLMDYTGTQWNWCIYTVWKTPTFLCGKFVKDTTYAILSESAEFCRKCEYDKNMLAYFFPVHGV